MKGHGDENLAEGELWDLGCLGCQQALSEQHSRASSLPTVKLKMERKAKSKENRR